jgi:Domain of Unknown Function (DUF1206)
VWRFLQAIIGRDLEGGEDEGLLKRGSYVARGVFYAGLCVLTVLLLVDANPEGGGGAQKEDRATAWVLDLPRGPWIVGLVGVGVLGAGAFNAFRAVTGKYRDDLKLGEMSSLEERWATRIGFVGHAARAVVFTLIGIFLIRAAEQYDPKEALGLDGALQKLAQQDYGAWLLGLVAAGLFAYGLFCLVQARYREV